VRGGLGWVLAAAVLAFDGPASGSPPITEGWKPQPVTPAADTSVERTARQAESHAYSVTNTGVILGAVVMLSSLPAGSAEVFGIGIGVAGAGAVMGPALGWSRAGYGGRAVASGALRLGIVSLAMARLLWGSDHNYATELDAATLISSALLGVGIATLEAYYENGTIGAYVRKHGRGGPALTLEARPSPCGLPALALTARFH